MKTINTGENFLVKSDKLDERHHLNLKQNKFLASLPDDDLNFLMDSLKLVHLSLGESLYSPSLAIKHLYFPVNSVVSLHIVIESGATAEIASVGKEGVVGTPFIMGHDQIESSATVLISGYAFKIDSLVFKNYFLQNINLQHMLLMHIQSLTNQIGQIAICYRHHNIQQQLARWLLCAHEKVSTNDLVVTQELMGGVFGVRRESVTQAAISLQNAGVINYRRGHISVLNHDGLKKYACECYKVMQKEIVKTSVQLT